MKDAENEAFDDLAQRQGDWGGGFPAKRAMAADKLQEPAQEPVAYVTGVYGGRFTYEPLNRAIVLPTGMALYATPQHTATWVGLTDADIERIKLMTYEKETNADGEEQEAVNIDWLIKTTEHFCKEKNNGT